MKKVILLLLAIVFIIALVISNSPFPQFSKTQLQTINVQEGLD